jgi:GT2 family glycosyltransferase
MKTLNSKFGVIIPCIRPRSLYQLIECLDNQTVRPDSVFVYDNTEDQFIGLHPNRFSEYIIYKDAVHPGNVGVNKAWMDGIYWLKDSCNIIAFLNDDILISPNWVEDTLHKMHLVPGAGIVCPTLVQTPIECQNTTNYSNKSWAFMAKREGWCFACDKRVLSYMPPIPTHELKIFCGDDWIFYFAKKAGFIWVKSNDSKVYHKPGASGDKQFAAILKKEKALFNKYMLQ